MESVEIRLLEVVGKYESARVARKSDFYVSAWFAQHNEPTDMTLLPIGDAQERMVVPYSPSNALKLGFHLIIQLREATQADLGHMRSKGTMTLGQTRLDLTERDPKTGKFKYLVDSADAVEIEFHNPWQVYDNYPIKAKIAIKGPHMNMVGLKEGVGTDRTCLSPDDFRTIHDWLSYHSTTQFRKKNKLHPFIQGANRVFLDSLMMCGQFVPPWVYFTQRVRKDAGMTKEAYFVSAMNGALSAVSYLGVREALIDLVLPSTPVLASMLKHVFLLAEPTGPISELPMEPEYYAGVPKPILWLLQISVRTIDRFAQTTLYDTDRTRITPTGEVAIDDFDPASNKLSGPRPITGDCEDGAMSISRLHDDLIKLRVINPLLRKVQAVLRLYDAAITLGMTEGTTPGEHASKTGSCFNSHMFVCMVPKQYMRTQKGKPHYGTPTASTDLEAVPDNSIYITPSDIRPDNRAGKIASDIQSVASDACFHALIHMHRPSLYLGVCTMFFTSPEYPVQCEVMIRKGVYGCSLETFFKGGAALVSSGPVLDEAGLHALYILHGYLHPIIGMPSTPSEPYVRPVGDRPGTWFYVNGDSIQVGLIESVLRKEKGTRVLRKERKTVAGTMFEYSVYY